MEWSNYCKERDRIENGPIEEGLEIDETLPHCFHDHTEGMVCCFCGGLFAADESRARKHGPYATQPMKRSR